jgi:hypothetical protein
MPFLRNILVTTSLLLFSHLINAQEKYDGYVILPSGDTVHGSILYPKIDGNVDFTEMHKWVQFADSNWDIKIYKPKELNGFALLEGPQYGKYVSKEVDGKNKFLKLLRGGYWQLFLEDYVLDVIKRYPNGVPIGNPFKEKLHTNYYLDNQSELIALKQKDGRFVIKQLKQIFKDYPQILEKLEGDMLLHKFTKILESFNDTMDASSK